MLFGSYQPGRMKRAEDRIVALEKSDIRRSVYDRLLNAVIAISVVILMHDRFKSKYAFLSRVDTFAVRFHLNHIVKEKQRWIFHPSCCRRLFLPWSQELRTCSAIVPGPKRKTRRYRLYKLPCRWRVQSRAAKSSMRQGSRRLSMVIDGVVKCLNASVWAKKPSAIGNSAVSDQPSEKPSQG